MREDTSGEIDSQKPRNPSNFFLQRSRLDLARIFERLDEKIEFMSTKVLPAESTPTHPPKDMMAVEVTEHMIRSHKGGEDTFELT
ncbi:hypothetical protein EVAR_69890_1 [Eumeta japonica]|uniref:Uncharacterized protein n=1 Tax=Eumeta variegata TaxID=151549 RepID=A0A4C1ZQ44_EUMVA|nr:hypothetical protein EVAR_69890_1 [Eumeta japonica]